MTPEGSGKLNTILVATDFSETAEAGLDWAVDMAKAHGASIDLVHALVMPYEAGDYTPSSHHMTEELQRAALTRLDESAGRARDRGIEVKPELLLGLPSRSILEAATSTPAADLIVIGTRGLTGIHHLLLGSTAERVVKNAKCPVLSIHPNDVEDHRPLQTILIPTDFSEDAELAVAVATGLLPEGSSGARLILLHAYHLPFEYTAYGAVPTSFDYLADTEGEALEKLKTKAAELAQEGFEVEVLAKEGYPPDVIVGEAKAANADLIAMGTQGRSAIANLLLGSTAERVVQHAECPVLTVPRPAD